MELFHIIIEPLFSHQLASRFFKHFFLLLFYGAPRGAFGRLSELCELETVSRDLKVEKEVSVSTFRVKSLKIKLQGVNIVMVD